MLVTGGARSGKSAWAETQFSSYPRVDYVATSEARADDPDWQCRIQLHQERRPASWRTIETADIAGVLLTSDEAPILVDCLGVWLTRLLDDAGAWSDAPDWRSELQREVDALIAAIEQTSREVIFVSNEVGMSVVPQTPAGRLFRDELGRLNATVAAAVDEVWLSVCGITRRWDA